MYVKFAGMSLTESCLTNAPFAVPKKSSLLTLISEAGETGSHDHRKKWGNYGN